MIARSLASLMLAVLLLLSVAAQAAPLPQPPQIPVKAYVLIDYSSGNVLANNRAEERLEPASITKLMSAYVIYGKLKEGAVKLDDMVLVSERAWRVEGSRMFAKVGSQVALETMLHGMVIQSGNDATVALAEHVAGSEETFVTLMNQTAQRLGMKNSHFMNATGLPNPQHYSSAHDLAILARALIHDFPEQYKLYSEKEFVWNNIKQPNRNRLLWQDPSVDGVKTGHTNAAGYCLVSSAKRNDTRLVAVVLGAEKEKERFSGSQALLNYGFSFFETHKLYDAGKALTEARVWKGSENNLPLGLNETLFVTVPKGRYGELSANLKLNETIMAPVQAGQTFGSVVVSLGGQVVQEVPLVAMQAIEEAGFFGRLLDSILMWLNSLFS